MSYDHFLAGPCEGMSFHIDGRTVQYRDENGREKDYVQVFEDEIRASAFMWTVRDLLYHKYGRGAE